MKDSTPSFEGDPVANFARWCVVVPIVHWCGTVQCGAGWSYYGAGSGVLYTQLGIHRRNQVMRTTAPFYTSTIVTYVPVVESHWRGNPQSVVDLEASDGRQEKQLDHPVKVFDRIIVAEFKRLLFNYMQCSSAPEHGVLHNLT